MNIGLFGGTFDPIHLGHIALVKAAQERCKLGRIYFVPANVPPHKQQHPLSPFAHRYAMVALATAAEKTWIPSSLEAPPEDEASNSKRSTKAAPANYSIDTVRRLKQSFGKSDQLFFLIGIDAFNDIAKWHEAEALFREVEFIVASRPGFSLADVANALPEKLRPKENITKPFAKIPAGGELVLPGVKLHLLEDVKKDVSATAIRQAAAAKKSLARFVTPEVADYIKKTSLYGSR
jgi:nicotinate-nucleotide adenylyltransferase